MIVDVKLYKNQYRFVIQKQRFRTVGLQFLAFGPLGGPERTEGPKSEALSTKRLFLYYKSILVFI